MILPQAVTQRWTKKWWMPRASSYTRQFRNATLSSKFWLSLVLAAISTSCLRTLGNKSSISSKPYLQLEKSIFRQSSIPWLPRHSTIQTLLPFCNSFSLVDAIHSIVISRRPWWTILTTRSPNPTCGRYWCQRSSTERHSISCSSSYSTKDWSR